MPRVLPPRRTAYIAVSLFATLTACAEDDTVAGAATIDTSVDSTGDVPTFDNSTPKDAGPDVVTADQPSPDLQPVDVPTDMPPDSQSQCPPGKSCDDGDVCSDDGCDPAKGCVHLPNTATCSDGNACTGPDLCKDGNCATAALSCDDLNSCTDDTCDAKTGCAHINNAASCVDDNACNLGDLCEGGTCKGGKAKDCDDANPCTKDGCDAKTGVCSHDPVVDPGGLGVTCDDGNPCTNGDSCATGQCAGKPVTCDDGNACTTDKCDPKTGCAYVDNQGPCDDSNKCSDFDKCDQGKCKGAAKDVAADCDDGNPCTTDGCDKATGCTHKGNTGPCDDGNTCTQGDTCVLAEPGKPESGGKCESGLNTCDCQKDADCAAKEDGNACNGTLFCDKGKGQCVVNPKTVVTCATDGNGPCAQKKCDPATGKCALQAVNEGNPCDADGSVCTPDDACKEGVCKAGQKLACDDKNECTTDSCDLAAGCKYVANQALCDADGNACTASDTCQDKVCLAGKLKVCDDGNVCTADVCDTKTGSCGNDGLPKAGQPCDADGSNCTVGDSCSGGVCKAGPALVCDDKNGCTADTCNSVSGCVSMAIAVTCDADGDACTQGDHCDNKLCLAGAKKNCDDGDACTTDACDPKTGACSHKPIVGCGGNCASDKDCDDENLCTDDTCVLAVPGDLTSGKCKLAPNTTSCDDGSVCTKVDACSGGKCGGVAIVCDDANPCTTDSCDAKAGCTASNNSAPCDDGDACSTGDTCNGGKCGAGKPKLCDDGDACTKDTCNPANGSCNFNGIPGCGPYCAKVADCDDKNPCTDESCQGGKCVSGANTIACNDSNPCTLNDLCQGGTCKAGAPKACGDNNACTLDSCDAGTGNCVNTPLAATNTCDDGNACTTGDTCGGKGPSGQAICVGTAKDCDDGNACTADTCNPASAGCNHTNSTGPCDEGNPCTPGDACQDGKCVAGTQLWLDALAGHGTIGKANGKGTAAQFHYPLGIAVDGGGTVFVADSYNHLIRKIAPDGTATTIAGSAQPGYVDAKGAAAAFHFPFGLALDAKGNLIVADTNNNVLRKVAPDGTVTTFAGTGTAGALDGDTSTARFNHAYGVAIAPSGLVAVADTGSQKIRLVHPNGKVTTLAGNGSAAFADDPDGKKAAFYNPIGVAFGGSGNLVVADQSNHRIRKVTPQGAVTTLAGDGVSGYAEGDVTKARFQNPWGVAVSPSGVVYVSDRYNHRIRTIAGGKTATVIGTGVAGFQDGVAATARLHYPAQLAFAPSGYLYVADGHNHRIRRARDGSSWCQIGGACATGGWSNPQNACQVCDPKTSTSQWTTLADAALCSDGDACTDKDACDKGACKGGAVTCDDKDSCTTDSCDAATGLCSSAPIVGCGGNCVKDGDCDDKNLCTDDKCTAGKCGSTANTAPCDDKNPCTLGDVCNGGNCTAGNQIEVTTLAGSTQGFQDGKGAAAQFRRPFGIDVGSDGLVYVTEYENHSVRKIAPDGTVTTIAGSGNAAFADGKGNQASFSYPADVKLAPDGNLYVVERGNHRVRKIEPDGTVTTFAGGPAGYVDGPVLAARFNDPISLDVNAAGVIVVSEYGNHRVRRIQDGVVTTLAGSTNGYKDGKGGAAQLGGPIGIAFDGAGNVVVAEYNNHRIRRISPDGVVTTVAGSGIAGYLDGDAASAQFQQPWGIAVDTAGNILVTDRSNHRLRRISPSGVVTKWAGTGQAAWKDGYGAVAQFSYPTGIAFDVFGNVFVGDDQTHRVRKVQDGSKPCQIGGACYAAGTADPDNSCQACNAAKDAAGWSTKADGAACSDGKGCTLPDKCQGGGCASIDKNCDDGDKCTTDSCDAATGACVSKPIVGCDGYCDNNGQCDDSNVCTNDACATNKCSFTNNTAPCDDGQVCTIGDTCNGGKCEAGTLTWVDTLAGGAAGYKDDKGAAAQFNYPFGVDRNTDGAVYVADTGNHRLRKIAADGTVTTFAGSGNAGFLDAKGTAAWFSAPADLDHDAAGNLYVSERDNHAVRIVQPDGTVKAVAGSGAPGAVDDVGAKAKFNTPYGIAVTAGGIAYVADYANHRVRKVLPDGTVSTLAGSGVGYKDDVGKKAQFNQPIAVALDRGGTVFVAEYSGHKIRRITPDGAVTTVAGTGDEGLLDGAPNQARFRYPMGIAVDTQGTVFVADRYNHRLRRITWDGSNYDAVYTWAGGSNAAWKDGAALQAWFLYPVSLTVDASGSLLVGDGHNHRIRRVRATALACEISGACYANGTDNPSQTCQACDGSKSTKQWTAKADTAACADGDYCTTTDTCGGGKCSGGKNGCDDQDACTADSCEATSGACLHAKIQNCP